MGLSEETSTPVWEKRALNREGDDGALQLAHALLAVSPGQVPLPKPLLHLRPLQMLGLGVRLEERLEKRAPEAKLSSEKGQLWQG